MTTSEQQLVVNLSGKVAIVTGAAKGIGAAIAASLSAAQAIVVVSDIDDESGRQLAGQLGEDSKKAVYVRADVSHSSDIDNLFRATRGQGCHYAASKAAIIQLLG